MIELFLAIVLVATSYVFQGNIGLNLADEGFLWNGVLRISQGKIPIRDYKSYDPGRFYWLFACGKILGHGILGIRRSAAVFQIIGLWAGLLALSRVTDNIWLLFLSGVVLIWWMQPRHKVFEHAISLMAIFMGVILIEAPTFFTLFLTGVFVGLAGFMGRNHGVYTFVAFAALISAIWLENGFENFFERHSIWLLGIAIGYSPMLSMWLFVPDMFNRYWNDKVMVFARRGSANLPLPVPWPWRAKYTKAGLRHNLAAFLLGTHYLLLPVFYLTAGIWIITSSSLANQPVLAASVFIGMLYMHHAFSRADLSHLCQAIQPFLLASLSVALSQTNQTTMIALVGMIVISGFFTTIPLVPLMARWDTPGGFVEFDLRGEKLFIPANQARFLARLSDFVKQNIAPEQPMFIAPITPALYPILRKQTPVRSDFLLFPETEEVQRNKIGDLEEKRVDWALIQDVALDGRDELRFRNTHALVWDYIQAEFETVPVPGIDESWRMFVRKDSLT